jgi:DNA-binding response OmpR family regulator
MACYNNTLKPIAMEQGVIMSEEAKTSFKDKKVLIVEDTIELAEVIQATVERMGITVFHETHGNKAIDIFKAQNPDLILLDIGLPDMIGWKILDTLKQMENRPNVIVISAYGDPANRLMGKLQDVDAYLIKPFSPDEIERVVRNVLSKPDEPATNAT